MTPAFTSLPLLAALVAMLAVAVLRDLSRHRIDNLITFSGALLALALHALLGGWLGAAGALAGLGVGLLALLPFYLAGGMAAGDVKLMAAVGGFVGPVDAFWSVAWSLVAGGVMGVATLAVSGGLREGLLGTGRQFFGYAVTRVWVPAATGSAAARRFPYAAAIAGGTLAVVAWRATHHTVVGA